MIQLIRRLPPIKHLPGMMFDNSNKYVCSFPIGGDNSIIDVSIVEFGGNIFVPTVNAANPAISDHWEVVEKCPPYLHVHYCSRQRRNNKDYFQVILTGVFSSDNGKLITYHIPISDPTILTPNMWVGTEHSSIMIESDDPFSNTTVAYINALRILEEHYSTIQRVHIHAPIGGAQFNQICKEAEIATCKNPRFLTSWLEEIYLRQLGQQHGSIINSSELLKNTKANDEIISTDLESHCEQHSEIEVPETETVITQQVEKADEIITKSQSDNVKKVLTNDLVIHCLLGVCTDLNVTLEYNASTDKLYITKGTYGNRYGESEAMYDLYNLTSEMNVIPIDINKWIGKLQILVREFIKHHFEDGFAGVDHVEILYVNCTLVITVCMESGHTGKKHIAVISILDILPSIPMFTFDSNLGF